MEQSTFSLADTVNYHSGDEVEISSVLDHSILIISMCVSKVENALESRPLHYRRFMVSKSVECLSNIIRILFLYTANPSLVFYHTEKMIYFYIEFLQQIGNDVNHFLGLTSKDAAVFTYKKTIYDILASQRKDFKNKNKKHDENCLRLGSLLSYIQLLVSLGFDIGNNESESKDTTIVAGLSTLIRSLVELPYQKYAARLQYLTCLTTLVDEPKTDLSILPNALKSAFQKLSRQATLNLIDEKSEEDIQVMISKHSLTCGGKIEDIVRTTLFKSKGHK